MVILIIGACGSGKTWVMKNLISRLSISKLGKLGKFYFHYSQKYVALGKYDDSVFSGSDKLSMSVITDLDLILKFSEKKTIICEGDRFTNSTFIVKADPIIIKILDDGSNGRILRNSAQTERHLKSIATRVSNIKENYNVSDSNQCLNLILDLIQNEKGNK